MATNLPLALRSFLPTCGETLALALGDVQIAGRSLIC